MFKNCHHLHHLKSIRCSIACASASEVRGRIKRENNKVAKLSATALQIPDLSDLLSDLTYHYQLSRSNFPC